MNFKFIFGPVPSRRLGQSLGIRNVPYKYCTYSCIYCQLGPTIHKIVERRFFYKNPEDIVKEVKHVLNKGVKIDYVTFVPEGEPTLDKLLGLTVEKVKELGVRTAILTNSSLLWIQDVFNDLLKFDYVSLKIDTVNEDLWKVINRPHPKLRFDYILDSIKLFTKKFRNVCVVEIMLISGVNDDEYNLDNLAKFIKMLNIHKVYISIPIRPPTEAWVRPPSEEKLTKAYAILSKYINETKLELLNMYEGNRFQVINDPVQYILNISSVHPIRLDYALEILSKYFERPEEIINDLVKKDLVRVVEYLGKHFIIRKFSTKFVS